METPADAPASPSGRAPGPARRSHATGPPPRPWRLWEAYLLVFGSSLCTLVLELVAGRLLAPIIGVSLFTWTGVIGVVLAGVAAGSYLGGLTARRSASPMAIAGVLATAAVVTWATALIVRLVALDALFRGFTPLGRIVALVGAFFFVPSALLGMVSPLVAQITLQQRAEAGAVVGRLGAVSAAGSIVGTFLTGFVLVPTFGTRTILLAVSIVLLALALSTVAGRVPRGGGRHWVGLTLAALLAGGGTGIALGRDRNACLRETAYSCSRIERSAVGPVEFGTLTHDRVVQGATAPDAPRLLVSPYAQAFGDVAVYQSQQYQASSPALAGRPLRVLFVGGGSFTLPRYLEAVDPGSELEVLEIDPGVTATARERLGLRTVEEGGRIRVTHGDARLSLRRLPDAAYDLAYGDAFNDLAVPWHLTTAEFGREVRRVLRPEGLYATNVIDTWPSGLFLASFVRTLQEVFPSVDVLRVQDWSERGLSNWVVVASRAPVDAERLGRLTRPGVPGDEPGRARPLGADQIRRWLAGVTPAPLVLTDDYAPVDRFLADRLLAP